MTEQELIEAVKKILDKERSKTHLEYTGNGWSYTYDTDNTTLAHQICQLFEQEDDPDWAGARHYPELDKPELARIWSEDGTGGVATGANKPDEDRLLTDFEQQRVERIFMEIESKAKTERFEIQGIFTDLLELLENTDWWQAIKQQEEMK